MSARHATPRCLLVGLVLALVAGAGALSPTRASSAAAAEPVGPPRFRTLDVMVDSARPLVAYQVAIDVLEGDGRVIGVEGGEAPFSEPPYYDPAALMQGRIILAAFSTATALPPGRHRVATIHVREAGGEPVYQVALEVAGTTGGARVPAEVSLEPGKEER